MTKLATEEPAKSAPVRVEPKGLLTKLRLRRRREQVDAKTTLVETFRKLRVGG